jgi:hypothetical protein
MLSTRAVKSPLDSRWLHVRRAQLDTRAMSAGKIGWPRGRRGVEFAGGGSLLLA